MKVTLVLVTSINGKLTCGDDPNIYSWTSKEDQKHFFSLIQKHDLIIMGRKTYEGAKAHIKLVAGKRRVVMTRDATRFESETVEGQLEFSDESPAELIDRMERLGYTQALLVGGSEIAAAFFQAHLVDELMLTLEPYLFGTGTQFGNTNFPEVTLSLQEVKQLNEQGSVFLHYRVKKVMSK